MSANKGKNYTTSFLKLICLLLISFAHASDEDTIERPWLTRDFVIGGIRLPITPMTIIIFSLSALIIYSSFTKPSTAVASHILIDDHSEKTEAKLAEMMKEIGNDKKKFAEYAAKYSTCPSKSNGGSLGKFKYGDMVPPFNKAVFSIKSNVGEVIGPVHTQFGWHLILIHERDEQRQLVAE